MRAVVGSMMKEGDIVVASESKSKLWKDMSLTRAFQNWNVKYGDVARSPESALREFTGSERLANHVKINEIGEVGKLTKRTEMDAPKIGKLVKNDEMGDSKVVNIGEVGK